MVAARSVLHVAEGEKCADALNAAGLLATTSQGGSGAAYKTDWAPAAAFAKVVIWEDVDEDRGAGSVGQKYAQEVAALIHAAASGEARKPEIYLVDLRPLDLKPGEDVFELIERERAAGKDGEDLASYLRTVADECGRRWAAPVDFSYPNQPAPPGPPPVGSARRRLIENHSMEVVEVPDAKGGTRTVEVPRALQLDDVRARLQAVAEGWPLRLHATGGKSALLFVDTGLGFVRWIEDQAGLRAFAMERGDVRFLQKEDGRGKNFVSFMDLFKDFGASVLVPEFRAVEHFPHEPLMEGHYYTWCPPAYNPDGSKLAGLLAFFDNCANARSLVLHAAAIVTPFWGGPYGKRPAFVYTAPDRGCGKSNAAATVGFLAGGILSVELTQSDEPKLKERLLSPSGMEKRVLRVDNVKGAVDSSLLDSLVTDEEISGKRLYHGEASRPNVLTVLITANNAQLSSDMARRCFFIELQRPKRDENWERDLLTYRSKWKAEIVADILHLLRRPLPATDAGYRKALQDANESWPVWTHEVLARVLAYGPLADVVGEVKLADVLLGNRETRDESDEGKEEADTFWAGLVERVASNEGFVQDDGSTVRDEAVHDVFVPNEAMCVFWEQVFARKVNAKWLKRRMTEHLEAGRLPGMEWRRRGTGRGYVLHSRAMITYLEAVRAEQKDGVRQATFGEEIPEFR